MKDRITKAYDSVEFDENRKNEILNSVLFRCDDTGKEKRIMKKRRIKPLVLAAVLILICIPAGVFAGHHFMSGEGAADLIGGGELSALFDDSDIVASCEDGDYRIAYLGKADGKLSRELLSENDSDETYVALAVERLDGKPVSEDETFVASPLIQGLDPNIYNVYAFDGGASWKIKDGILYMIMNVDSVEMFGDRTVYLAITRGPDYAEGFCYNEESGVIEANDEFEGINALFEMEMEQSKADVGAQSDFIKAADERMGSNGDEVEFICNDENIRSFLEYDFSKLDSDVAMKVVDSGELAESYDFIPENGYYNIKVNCEGMTVEGQQSIETFPVNKPIINVFYYDEDGEYLVLEYSKRDKDNILHDDFYKLDRTRIQKALKLLK